MNIQLSEGEASTITNALYVAADRYEENAANMRELADAGGGSMITAAGAKGLAEQFDRQVEDARRFAREFAEAEAIIIQTFSG